MLKSFVKALAVGSAAIGAGVLSEFGLSKAKADAPKAVKVAVKFAGGAVGAGVAMAILK